MNGSDSFSRTWLEGSTPCKGVYQEDEDTEKLLMLLLKTRRRSGKHPFAYCVCTAGDSIGLTIENLNDTIALNASLQALGITEVSASTHSSCRNLM